jgi:hypothetical protein
VSEPRKIYPQMRLMKKKEDFFLICVICSANPPPGRRGTSSHAGRDRHAAKRRLASRAGAQRTITILSVFIHVHLWPKTLRFVCGQRLRQVICG